MRKFICAALLLTAAAACKKSTQPPPGASASFQRTLNGTSFWSWDYSSATSTNLSFTQTYYTGSTSGNKQIRWTLSLVDANAPSSLIFSFPGIDTTLTLPSSNEMTFQYRINQPASSDNISCGLNEKGTLYLGSDSTFMDITILSISKTLVSGDFTISMYNPGYTCSLTNGHFANIPIVYTSQ
jgi:hypothetical protein